MKNDRKLKEIYRMRYKSLPLFNYFTTAVSFFVVDRALESC